MTNPAAPMPATIGDYCITAHLGSGGQGSVYCGYHRDDECQQPVAIKLLADHIDTQQWQHNLDNERSILANLQHAYIVGWREAGTTPSGQPYLVMEYIEGQPLTTYCQQYHSRIEERIDLFIKVCQAVAFTHRNLVLHLDLKPSNILITAQGIPKLVDFGIAKLIHASPPTQESIAPIFTPIYASPEWLKGDPVSVASDVYALGVLLYELLAEQQPPLTPAATSAAYLEKRDLQFPLPSQVAKRQARQLKGDLDQIVRKALHIQPADRYASVAALLQDLQDYRDGYPISARKASFAQILYKAALRYPYTSAAIGISLTLALIATYGALEYRAQSQLAQQQSQQITQLASSLLENQDPFAPQTATTMAQRLDDAERQLETIFADAPEQQAQLYHYLATLALDQDMPQRTKHLLDKALKLQEGQNPQAPIYAEMQAQLAQWHQRQQNHRAAADLLAQALPRLADNRQQRPAPYHQALLTAARTADTPQQAQHYLNLARQHIDDTPQAPLAWLSELQALEQ